MTSGGRRTRNYKEKRPMLAFGQIVLPIAALVAVGLLFVGIKLFFLTPPDRGGVEVPAGAESIREMGNLEDKSSDVVSSVVLAKSEEEKPQPKQNVVLAGPIDPAKPARNDAKTVTAKPSAPKPNVETGTKPAVKPTPSPAAAKKPDTTPVKVAATGSWAVQIGAFTKEEGAKTLSAQAKNDGYATTISATDSSSGTKFYRVRVSAGDSREKAEKLAAELEKKGYPASVFPIR